MQKSPKVYIRVLQQEGEQLIESRAGFNAWFVAAAGEECLFVSSEGTGVYGQLFSSSGENINELLIAGGHVLPSIDPCGGDALLGCYSGIPAEERFSSLVINDFLWKPASERDVSLVVLVNPFDVLVRVEGSVTEDLVDFGPSNGRGTTGRSSRSGCGFGSNRPFNGCALLSRGEHTLAGRFYSERRVSNLHGALLSPGAI